MSKSLYITATESRSGKSAVALGVMETLFRRIGNVGFFRPLVSPGPRGYDHCTDLFVTRFGLGDVCEDNYGMTASEAAALFSEGREGEIIDTILHKFHNLQQHRDFVVCLGTDYMSTISAFEFDLNATIAKNLGAPVMLVAQAHDVAEDDLIKSTLIAMDSLHEASCEVVAVVLNRVEPSEQPHIYSRFQKAFHQDDHPLVYALPNDPHLDRPSMAELAEALNARVLLGEELMHRHVSDFVVAAMQLRNMLPRLKDGALVITPGDRADVIIACLTSVGSAEMPNIAGLLLSGGLKPEKPIWNLIKGMPRSVPVLSYDKDTYETAMDVDGIYPHISPQNERKITRALALFDHYVDGDELADRIVESKPAVVTPKMFEFNLIQTARKSRQHIVLPEGEDERVLRAAEILVRREVVHLTLLGHEERIREQIGVLGLRLKKTRIVDPSQSELLDDFVETYYKLRQHKNITREFARDAMNDVSFFGTMMIYKGLADGMVSGAVHTTGHTILPAFQFIKTKPGVQIVSSVFFMLLPDRVLVYGDCAVNPNPTAEELADIALASARTARTFGVDPYVAMLSYSTGESGQGEDVDRVREATRIARDQAARSDPSLKIEGPIQYDAAVDTAVARTKMPDSEVAGRATVFIFPDLNTGNNTYKAVQRSAGAVAVGPVLQGLKRPVNDLSRGCTVSDIVNTVAITAIQAQAEKGRL
jgi:phosphate acetyltransferase